MFAYLHFLNLVLDSCLRRNDDGEAIVITRSDSDVVISVHAKGAEPIGPAPTISADL
jgi:hypothetical protein